jgi:hypothetical protein
MEVAHQTFGREGVIDVFGGCNRRESVHISKYPRSLAKVACPHRINHRGGEPKKPAL